MIGKILLWVLFAVLCIIGILLLSKVRLRLIYRDQTQRVYLGFLLFRFNLTNQKRHKRAKKRSLRKDLMVQEKEQKRFSSQKPSGNRAKGRHQANVSSSGQKRFQSLSGPKKLSDWIPLVRKLVIELAKRFPRMLRVKIRQLTVVAGGEDAMAVGMAYGSLCAAAASLYAVIANLPQIHLATKHYDVRADFMAEKTTAEIDIVLSVYLWQLVKGGIRMLAIYSNHQDDKNKWDDWGKDEKDGEQAAAQ